MFPVYGVIDSNIRQIQFGLSDIRAWEEMYVPALPVQLVDPPRSVNTVGHGDKQNAQRPLGHRPTFVARGSLESINVSYHKPELLFMETPAMSVGREPEHLAMIGVVSREVDSGDADEVRQSTPYEWRLS